MGAEGTRGGGGRKRRDGGGARGRKDVGGTLDIHLIVRELQ